MAKGENRHHMNTRLASAYRQSLMAGAVAAAKSGKDTKEGHKNFKRWLNTNLPKEKGKWDVERDDVYDLRASHDQPKRGWQMQHDVLSDITAAQDDFQLKTNRKNEWIAPMFEQKGFAMNSPFGNNFNVGGVGYASQMDTRPVGSIAPFAPQAQPPGGIQNTGSFYDLAINPVSGRERLGFGLGGYTVMS